MSPRPQRDTRERIYAYVRSRLLRGDPPTVRDVQAAAGLKAVESARRHLERLVEEGRLGKLPGRARGYCLPEGEAAPAALMRIPLLGQVQAGALTTALEQPEGYISVERRAGASELFALRVRGESMRDAGIFPGDVVVVRRQPSAESGEIVVALVDDEATVKVLRRRGRRLVLDPANPAFAPIEPPPEALQILGRVVELRRRLD